RKDFLKKISIGTAGLGISSVLPIVKNKDVVYEETSQLSNRSRNKHYISNRKPLTAQPYTELPVGNIKPKGWLLEQLKRQRDGLTGNIDEIYTKVLGSSNGW